MKRVFISATAAALLLAGVANAQTTTRLARPAATQEAQPALSQQETLQAQITSLQNQQETIQKQIEVLQKQQESLNVQQRTLQKQLDELQKQPAAPQTRQAK
jgi:peptidoglycan hydrolase CwlO-like protein